MATVATERERLTLERLNDEIAYYPAFIRKRKRTECVEKPNNSDFHLMHTLVIDAEHFSNVIGFVVATTIIDHILAIPVALGLEMNQKLASLSQKQPCSDAAKKAEHVVGAHKADFRCFERVEVELVMRRRGRTSEMPNQDNFELDRFGEVMKV